MDITGKRIIVTGGASGIAAAAVRALVTAGAKVASLDIDDEAGMRVASKALTNGPGACKYFHCDVADRGSVDAAFDAAAEWLGGLDSMFNIAGVEWSAPAEDIDDAHWDKMMDVNARGTILTNQAAFRHLRDHGGKIINFGSAAGVNGMPGGAAYSAAKAAVIGFTRTAAKEWGRYNITVNAMAPAIWTPMYEKHRARLSPDELATHESMLKMTMPIGGKLGDPDRDLAPVLIFLASDGAGFITGQVLPVDGGILIG